MRSRPCPRQQPDRIKPEIVRERGFTTIHLLEGDGRLIDYSPVAARRVIACRAPQAAGIDKDVAGCFEEFLTSSTNQRPRTRRDYEIVFLGNDRCDQENLIAHQGWGHALKTPGDIG